MTPHQPATPPLPSRGLRISIPAPALALLAACLLPAAHAADLGLRFYHPHEVSQLLAAPPKSYARAAQTTTVVEFNPLRYPKEAPSVRKCFPHALLTDEYIIEGVDADSTTEATFDRLVDLLAAGEASGWEWGDILVYREPLFQAVIPSQKLLPGPWHDRRLISCQDSLMLRTRLARAHSEGKLKQRSYRICGLIYSWCSITQAEKDFIQAKLDGIYVELNTRAGKWTVDGNPTTIADPFKNPGHDFPAFGLPGTKDTAAMAAWCLAHSKHFGITSGANEKDQWYRAMFQDYLTRAKEAGVDTASPAITYLMHHNRKVDDKGLLYFPENQPDTMTNLVNFLDQSVGPHASVPK